MYYTNDEKSYSAQLDGMNSEMVYFFVTETKLLADRERKTHINYPIDTLFLIVNSPNHPEIEYKKCIPFEQPSPETIAGAITKRHDQLQQNVVILLDSEINSIDINSLFRQLSEKFQRIYFVNFRPQQEDDEDFIELKPEEQEMMLFDDITEFDAENKK